MERWPSFPGDIKKDDLLAIFTIWGKLTGYKPTRADMHYLGSQGIAELRKGNLTYRHRRDAVFYGAQQDDGYFFYGSVVLGDLDAKKRTEELNRLVELYAKCRRKSAHESAQPLQERLDVQFALERPRVLLSAVSYCTPQRDEHVKTLRGVQGVLFVLH